MRLNLARGFRLSADSVAAVGFGCELARGLLSRFFRPRVDEAAIRADERARMMKNLAHPLDAADGGLPPEVTG